MSLVEESRVPEFIEKLRTSYPPYHGLQGEELSEVVFPTKPSSGACSAYMHTYLHPTELTSVISIEARTVKSKYVYIYCRYKNTILKHI